MEAVPLQGARCGTRRIATHCEAVVLLCVREIRWTEEAEDHIAGHDVTPDEVEQLVNSRPRLVVAGRQETEYVFGATSAGRYLLVVLAEAIDGRDYVVTARDMTDAERQTFRRKGR